VGPCIISNRCRPVFGADLNGESAGIDHAKVTHVEPAMGEELFGPLKSIYGRYLIRRLHSWMMIVADTHTCGCVHELEREAPEIHRLNEALRSLSVGIKLKVPHCNADQHDDIILAKRTANTTQDEATTTTVTSLETMLTPTHIYSTAAIHGTRVLSTLNDARRPQLVPQTRLN
jgi:hypothetical protein